ncbi:MAG: flagellar basal body-associated FliL family protein [Bdellovibrio sp.]|nr:flagellar basal body-associated FliL family protein [Bdellovibrio sp.]
MADNKAETNAEPASPAPPAPSLVSRLAKLPILPILNIVAVLGAAGFAYYTKILYKRPPILEENERQRIAEEASRDNAGTPHAEIKFGPVQANIASAPHKPKAADGTSEQIDGKLHYITLSFSMNISDETQVDAVEAIRPIFLDKLNQILGKKDFHELNSIQGRYLLQAELIEVVNTLLAGNSPGHGSEGLVTGIYFTQFLVQ